MNFFGLNTNSPLRTAGLLGILAVSASAVAQDTLVSYATFPYTEVEGVERTSVTGDTSIAGVTGIDMTRGGGLLFTPTNNAFNSKGWATNVDATPTVLNTEGYVEIGFSLAEGYTATLDSLIIGTDSSTSGPSEIGVFASTDGFTTAIATITENGSFSNNIFSLASIGEISGDFTLRFMNTGGVTPAAPSVPGEEDMDEDSTWRIISHFDAGTFTDPQITGTVTAIPEPTSLVLLGLSGAALAMRRRWA